MIYTCRFCNWKSIHPERIKQHVEENHPVTKVSIEASQVQGGIAIKREDLERANINISGPRGYESSKLMTVPNSCRFCSFRSKKPEEMKEHLDQYHPTGAIELKVFQLNDPPGFAVMKEDMEAIQCSIR